MIAQTAAKGWGARGEPPGVFWTRIKTMSDEVPDFLKDRVNKFATACAEAKLGDIPHIVLVFNDQGTECFVGNTPHFQDRVRRIQVLLDVARQEIGQLQAQQNQAVDEALLMNLFQGRVPVA